MSHYLEYEEIEVNSPRSTIKAAFEYGIIEDGEHWISMMIDRNKTSHIYDEAEALQIYNKIKNSHIRYFESLKCKFKELLPVKGTCPAAAGQQLYIVLFTIMQTDSQGNMRMPKFLDEQRKCRLYKKFVLENPVDENKRRDGIC